MRFGDGEEDADVRNHSTQSMQRCNRRLYIYMSLYSTRVQQQNSKEKKKEKSAARAEEKRSLAYPNANACCAVSSRHPCSVNLLVSAPAYNYHPPRHCTHVNKRAQSVHAGCARRSEGRCYCLEIMPKFVRLPPSRRGKRERERERGSPASKGVQLLRWQES